MLQVGVTGGIGSGKSLVCRIFQTLGIPIYDADSRAKNLMTTDGILVREIKSEFGDLAYFPDGELNRAYLSQQTFGQPHRLEKLNQLVHPRVAEDYHNWVASQRAPYVIREAALLFEVGIYRKIDVMVVVTAPEEIRIKRVLQRDPQRDAAQVKAIMSRQWPEEEKVKRADYVITNDGLQMIIPQVLDIHHKILASRA